MPGRHQTSFVIEHEGGVYWFDAGENCAYAAHTGGVDLMKTRKLVISHTHMDHIGGLAHLLWTIRKLDKRTGALSCRDIDLYIPDLRAWDAQRQFLSFTEGGFLCDFTIHAHEITDGPLFSENGLSVTALHTRHLKHEDGTPWRAFGFSIEAGGKKIVYTGDTAGYEDYAPLLSNCDILLHETGHHHPVDVARRLADEGTAPALLAFMHHGRDILNNPTEQRALLDGVAGINARILNDGDEIELI